MMKVLSTKDTELLKLWVTLRSSNEQRTYWFLLALATTATVLLTNLDDLRALSGAVRGIMAVLGLEASFAGLSNAIAFRSDRERLNALIESLDSKEAKALFTVTFFAEVGPWVGFAFTVILFAAIWWIS